MRLLVICASLLSLTTQSDAMPQAGVADQKCKAGPVDLVFIIDSSRSVRPHEFETMRKFMINIIQTLDVGADATRVGVVQYSSQVQNVFSLKAFSKMADMVKGINEIIPLAQGTMTGLAIKYAMNVAFSPEEGARARVPDVAVIVTDGRPQDRVAEVAAAAREKGIEIYAVGVARADMGSLRAMASPPHEDHVFLVESFDLIHQFGLQFQDKLCGMDLCLESDHGCEHICESSPGSFHCECLPGYRLNDDGKTCAVIDLCAEGKHDCEQICISSPGSYTCDCNEGYTLNEDKKTCTVIDLCAEGKHDCEQICISSPGSFTCNCNAGYSLNKDKKTCTMINYCSFGNHSCQHECVGVLNGYFCRCNEGHALQEDGKTCQPINLCNTVEHGCDHQCVSTPGSYYCICPEGQLLQEDGKTCGTCRSANIDLVLLIDGSKSVRPQNFELVKQFVNQVVDSLDVSAHGTRVGLVQYSSRVRTEFPLSRYQSAEDIKSAVLKVEYMEKGTMTGLALKHMVENSFSEAEGARPAKRNIPRVGLVFTDGRSQDDITEWAKKAKDAGITMYAVGVGKAVEDELRVIASEPEDKHFFYTTDFTAINQIAENLKLNICAEESQGEIEVKDPCACESVVEFQQATMTSLENLTQKLSVMTARLEDLENQLLSRK
ncbi:matrilin-4 [Anguilla anguilla]|uniref:matrilin-4 n=1 Tax=Anguilla anguilla TaxID=7936 RepID=UPI0015ABA7CB|nr:matrilin-4 [Anguilla anguilla]XP_035242604.1 matrilin-4 [Anguilla anguilla]XP_035242605.1 matrilin-4 [Anguilla anguilla]